ncbi:MAG: hypothetical protein ABH874_06730 [Methanobacteriota archaeon]
MEKDDFLRTEYEQCRSAIENFDRILTDLRIKGITLVLAFDGVAALSGGRTLGIAVGGKEVAAAVVIQLVTLALLYPVYRLDTMYTEFLVTAVDRAIAIEERLSEPISLGGKEYPPLTKAITKAFRKKFKTIASIHRRIYILLGILSILLAAFYLIAG